MSDRFMRIYLLYILLPMIVIWISLWIWILWDEHKWWKKWDNDNLEVKMNDAHAEK